MEVILSAWTLGLALWSLYLFLSTINLHKHRTALRLDQYRWLEFVKKRKIL